MKSTSETILDRFEELVAENAKLKVALHEANDYADKLIEHKDMVCLPADLANLREANARFAFDNHMLRDKLDKLQKNLNIFLIMSDTPETDYEVNDKSFIYTMGGLPPVVVHVEFARKLERERDDIRAQLREEQQLHVQTLNERDEARETCSELVTDSDAITLARTVVRITQDRDEARGQRDRLAAALRKLADCDWVITPHDRMDAVREIARKALQSLTPNETL